MFMNFGPIGRDHDSRSQYYLFVGDTKYLQISQESIPNHFFKNNCVGDLTILDSFLHLLENTSTEQSWRSVLIFLGNFETLNIWNQETKKPRKHEAKKPRTKQLKKQETTKPRNQQTKIFSFAMKGILLPLNIPTPTPAPAPLLGDTRGIGGHEWSRDTGTLIVTSSLANVGDPFCLSRNAQCPATVPMTDGSKP